MDPVLLRDVQPAPLPRMDAISIAGRQRVLEHRTDPGLRIPGAGVTPAAEVWNPRRVPHLMWISRSHKSTTRCGYLSFNTRYVVPPLDPTQLTWDNSSWTWWMWWRLGQHAS